MKDSVNIVCLDWVGRSCLRYVEMTDVEYSDHLSAIRASEARARDAVDSLFLWTIAFFSFVLAVALIVRFIRGKSF